MAIPRCQWRHRCVVTLGKFLVALYSKPLWRKVKWKQRRKGDVRNVKHYHGRAEKQGRNLSNLSKISENPPSKRPSQRQISSQRFSVLLPLIVLPLELLPKFACRIGETYVEGNSGEPQLRQPCLGGAEETRVLGSRAPNGKPQRKLRFRDLRGKTLTFKQHCDYPRDPVILKTDA